MIAFSNDASVARPGLYVLGFRPEEQVERIVAHAAAQGRTRFAALAPEDAYGTRRLAAWRAAVAQMPGATAVIAETYPPDSDSPRAAVQQVAAFGRPGGLPPRGAGDGRRPRRRRRLPPPELPPPGFDAVLIADGGPRVSSIAALLAYYDIGPANVPLLGHDALAGRSGAAAAMPACRAPGSRPGRRTIARFDAPVRRGLRPRPAPLAVLAYDATALAVLLAQTQPRFTAAQLTDPQGFSAAPASSACGPTAWPSTGSPWSRSRPAAARARSGAPLVHRGRR